MKRIIIAIIAAMALSSCAVGSYSVSSGKADEASISFTVAGTKDCFVTAYIDGTATGVTAVSERRYRPERNIKKTAQNTIVLTPGSHEIKVVKDGQELYSKKIYVSAQEHKIVNL